MLECPIMLTMSPRELLPSCNRHVDAIVHDDAVALRSAASC